LAPRPRAGGVEPGPLSPIDSEKSWLTLALAGGMPSSIPAQGLADRLAAERRLRGILLEQV
jgi:hypothetical protein